MLLNVLMEIWKKRTLENVSDKSPEIRGVKFQYSDDSPPDSKWNIMVLLLKKERVFQISSWFK